MLYVKERLLKILKNDSTFTYDPINDLKGNTTLGIRVPTQIVTKVQTKNGYRLDNIRSRREGRDESGEIKKHTLLYKGLVISPGMRILYNQAMFHHVPLLYEVPVFIDDKELWEKCNEEVGAGRSSQNYFSLDAVTPNGQIIEMDGEQHYNGEEQDPGDKARDLYLFKKYWVEVHRFRSYQKNPDINFSIIKNDILTLPINGFPYMTNYDEVIWDSFYKRDILTCKAIDVLMTGEERTENRKVQERMNEILRTIKEGN